MSYRYGASKIAIFIKNVWNKEVLLQFTKSSGPGGQHLQKNATKVQLLWDVQNSGIFPQSYVQKLIERNDQYITQEGLLRLDTSVHRTQKANKDQTYNKLAKIIKSAFKEEKVRKKTVPPKWAVDKRIAAKKRKSKRRYLRTNIVG